MVADFFQANYGFSHRFCTRTKLFFSRTQHFVCEQNIVRIQIPFVHVKRCFVRRHVQNNFACIQKGLYPLKCLYTYTKFVYAYKRFCAHTKGFYMRTTCFVCVPKVVYVYKIVCTHTQYFIPIQKIMYACRFRGEGGGGVGV